ncbi:hypothetical protein H5410_036953 [Solanum commersonii]|uniref:Uncharacterized protein n=1 Tax=Solanum commersonii TaxID=4109 RepID=A0A9J5Y5R4_SOLCO|nr:hypothetical protein H5410_036953 [Solanum commersonii]
MPLKPYYGVVMGFIEILLLQKPIEYLIVEIRPYFIVSDGCLTWTMDLAEQLKIPILMFYPHNLMFCYVGHCLNVYTPHEKSISSTPKDFGQSRANEAFPTHCERYLGISCSSNANADMTLVCGEVLP